MSGVIVLNNADSFIGVICGLKSEAETVSSAVDASKLRIGVSGADAARAEELAVSLCRQGASAIVSVGVSGGLDPTLKAGDLIIGETVVAD
ncbi:MAG: phosphorylase family protein, partial [Hyphococcus sp.]